MVVYKIPDFTKLSAAVAKTDLIDLYYFFEESMKECSYYEYIKFLKRLTNKYSIMDYDGIITVITSNSRAKNQITVDCQNHVIILIEQENSSDLELLECMYMLVYKFTCEHGWLGIGIEPVYCVGCQICCEHYEVLYALAEHLDK